MVDNLTLGNNERDASCVTLLMHINTIQRYNITILFPLVLLQPNCVWVTSFAIEDQHTWKMNIIRSVTTT